MSSIVASYRRLHMDDFIKSTIQSIKNDLGLIRNRHIREIEEKPGVSKCSTIADRIESNLDEVVNEYELMIDDEENEIAKEQFDLLSGMLERLSLEIAALSKKQPDGLMNSFKVKQVNRVLEPLQNLLCNEPSSSYLDLVAEVEENAEKSRNSYSDVAVILSQYREACNEYYKKYNDTWSIDI